MILNPERLNVTQVVTNALGVKIINGKYCDDNPVPSEADISQQHDVSRSAVREAVKSLAAKGLITSRAHRGIQIQPESDWNLFDIDVLRWIRESNPSLKLLKELTELRLAFEPEAVMLAVTRKNIDKIECISAALERMRRAESGQDDLLESDIEFHLSILDASENRFFIQLGRILETNLRLGIRFTNNYVGEHIESYTNHKEIHDAIVSNEVKTSYESTRSLIEKSLSAIDIALSDDDKCYLT